MLAMWHIPPDTHRGRDALNAWQPGEAVSCCLAEDLGEILLNGGSAVDIDFVVRLTSEFPVIESILRMRKRLGEKRPTYPYPEQSTDGTQRSEFAIDYSAFSDQDRERMKDRGARFRVISQTEAPRKPNTRGPLSRNTIGR